MLKTHHAAARSDRTCRFGRAAQPAVRRSPGQPCRYGRVDAPGIPVTGERPIHSARIGRQVHRSTVAVAGLATFPVRAFAAIPSSGSATIDRPNQSRIPRFTYGNWSHLASWAISWPGEVGSLGQEEGDQLPEPGRVVHPRKVTRFGLDNEPRAGEEVSHLGHDSGRVTHVPTARQHQDR